MTRKPFPLIFRFSGIDGHDVRHGSVAQFSPDPHRPHPGYWLEAEVDPGSRGLSIVSSSVFCCSGEMLHVFWPIPEMFEFLGKLFGHQGIFCQKQVVVLLETVATGITPACGSLSGR